jgi:hypothetical protein
MFFGQEAAFESAFPAIRGIASAFSPAKGTLVSVPSILNHARSIPCRSPKRSMPTCKFQQEPGCAALLKAVMACRAGTDTGLIQGFRLAAHTEHIENCVRTLPNRHAQRSASKAIQIHMA